jgi:two-component system response regulator NreC
MPAELPFIYISDSQTYMSKSIRANKRMRKVPTAGPSPYQRPIELTKREQMVLNRVWMGAQNQDIADELIISVRTVEAHRAMIMRKFGVTNVAQLLRTALLGGFLELR